MFSAAKDYTLARIKAAAIRREPFPHVLIEEIFPPDFYAEMMQRKMPDSCYTPLVETGRVGGGYSAARLCFMPDRAEAAGQDSDNAQFWSEFIATYQDNVFLKAWLALFEPDIMKRVFEEPERFPIEKGKIEVGGEMFLMRDKQTYGLKPHMDSALKAISALFYLPADDSGVMMGTSLYVPDSVDAIVERGSHAKSGRHFVHVATIPYKPNTVFAFPNVMPSFHGVEPLDQPVSRDILLYDIKFSGMKPKPEAHDAAT